MTTYKKLEIPKDTAWERRSWKRWCPTWIKEVVYGVHNLIRWAPVIYRDRDWDDYYLMKVIQTKTLYMRNHLVADNRSEKTERVNRWTTVLLNLIERENDEFYACEYMDYYESNHEFVPIPDKQNRFELKSEITEERFDDYLNKYRRKAKLVLKQNRNLSQNKMRWCMEVARLNQSQCRRLLFDILKNRSSEWWD